MSKSHSAPSSVTNTSPCWNGFIVPGSTLRYGSSFCIVTRRPRDFSRLPRLEAVSPLPREEATHPVTQTGLVVPVDANCEAANFNSRGRSQLGAAAVGGLLVSGEGALSGSPTVHGVPPYQRPLVGAKA